METSFRKIDIDKYDEEVLNDEDLYDADPRDPDMVLEEAKQRQVAVRSSLAKWVFSYVAHYLFNLSHINA
jgi:actin related protein 2/3 complex subunit 5